MSMEDAGKTLISGTTYFVTAQITSLFFNFLTSIFIARSLGESGYGLWGLATSTFGIFGLLQGLFGIEPAIIRLVSKYSSEGKNELIRSIILTSLKLRLLSGSLVSIIVILSSSYVVILLNHPELSSILPILALSNAVLALNLSAVFDAFKKFRYTVTLNVTESLLRLVFIYICLGLGYGVIGVATGQVTSSIIISILVFLIVVSRLLPPKTACFNFSEYAYDFASISKQIFSYSLPLSVASLVHTFNIYFRSLMIGKFIGVEMLGYFTVAINLVNLLSMPTEMVAYTLFPIVSELDAREKKKEIEKMLAILFKNLVPIIAASVVFVQIFAPQIIHLLYVERFVFSAELLRMLVTITIPGVFFYLVNIFLKATGHPDIVLKVNLINSLIMNLAILVLVPMFGIMGLTVTMLVASFTWCPLLWIYFSRKALINLPFKIKSLGAFIPIMLTTAFALLLARPVILKNELFLIPSSVLTLLLALLLSCLTKQLTVEEITFLERCLPPPLQHLLNPFFMLLMRVAQIVRFDWR